MIDNDRVISLDTSKITNGRLCFVLMYRDADAH
jgi:hypothetical protein